MAIHGDEVNNLDPKPSYDHLLDMFKELHNNFEKLISKNYAIKKKIGKFY